MEDAESMRRELSGGSGVLFRGLPAGMKAEVSADKATVITSTDLRISSAEQATALKVECLELIRRANDRQLAMFTEDPPYIPDPLRAEAALEELQRITSAWSPSRPPSRFSVYVGGPEAESAQGVLIAFCKAPSETVSVVQRPGTPRVLDLYLSAQSWDDAQRAVRLLITVWELKAPLKAIIHPFVG